ncbi:SixA phosphatase family protein [Pararhizobium gei]|uniref:SixA phosphatase family protein n=1 Tax=Pararhizobium gei TaxID=1395951 RepID=UPI0023DC9A6B|nr:histidine phosphatase family protein [Rhizobium gei]
MSASPAPAFRLYLLRHAKAGSTQPGETDFDRALDEAGRREAAITGRMAARASYVPECILSSCARRCRETTAAFQAAIGDAVETRYLEELYTGTVEIYCHAITENAEGRSLLVVGHNPVIEEILQEIVGEEASAEAMPFGYSPGILAAIDLEDHPRPGVKPRGRLVGLIDPDCHRG